MRGQRVGAFAFVLVTLPFNASAYVEVLNFHGTTSEIYGRGVATTLPASVTNAGEWDVRGSIELGYSADDIDNYQVVGGSLSINGVSLGAFNGWSYSVDYYDGDGEDGGHGRAQDANFGIDFTSTEYGDSYFSLFSEDYSPGTNPGNVGSYLGSFPVGGYQSNWISIGNWPNAWEAGIQSRNLEFTWDEVDPPATPVSEPSPAPLAALGLACIFWLRHRRGRQ